MRRVGLGPIGLGLAGAVALAMTAGSAAAAAGKTPPQGCAWQKHSKTVVKHVRRHGQRRRIKRIKHWWTCSPQPVAFAPSPVLPVQPPLETPPTEEPGPQLSHLGVKAVEYSYTLSRPEVESGEVIVELNNQGEDPHNLVLEHEGTADPTQEIPATPSTSQASARLALSPGTYRLYCSLYKHEAKGMEATLVVSG